MILLMRMHGNGTSAMTLKLDPKGALSARIFYVIATTSLGSLSLFLYLVAE